MTWFWLALGAALCLATADLISKRYFSDLSLPEVVMARLAGVAPTGAILLLVIPWPPLDRDFFVTVSLALPVDLACTFLYVRAIQISPLALTQPFLAITPLASVLTGQVIMGEMPTLAGMGGLLLLAAGAYGLNLHLVRAGWLEPWRAIRREKGSWIMLLVAMAFAYTAVLGRRAVLHSSPLFMGALYPLLVGLGVALVLGLRGQLRWGWLRRPWPALAVALCVGGEIICHFLALASVQTAYMLAVKRLSPLFAVLWGAWLLGEGRLGQHLLASALMAAGAAVILIYG
ncbi:MAG: EamA family transporter [Desulfarculus sp.]|nr:EamA family transporter [Desulfarculus sp.]